MDYEIIKFEDDNVELEVNVSPEEETVWLTKEQIAVLFDRDRTVISRHINNIYKENELDRKSTCAKNAHIPSTRNRLYETELYNLDVIISVGYRVKSKNGVTFRKWANSVLKEYLLKGYAVNEERTLVTSENYSNLVNRVNKLESRIDKIEVKQSHLLIEDCLIFENQTFDAMVLINRLIETAKESITLIDPYVDVRTLNAFNSKTEGVTLYVITSSKTKLKQEQIDSFIEQYGNLIINVDDSFHDRYLIIDKEMLYHLGSSINYLGKRLSQITLVEDEFIIEALTKKALTK